MQANRKYRAKAMFIDQSLHKNNYTMEKCNLQGKICLLLQFKHCIVFYGIADIFRPKRTGLSKKYRDMIESQAAQYYYDD